MWYSVLIIVIHKYHRQCRERFADNYQQLHLTEVRWQAELWEV